MELIKLECPYCGAELSVKSEARECFCTYCGKKLLIKDDVHRSEVTAQINYKDMARLKELEMKEREIAKQEEKERLEAQAAANYAALIRRRIKSWFSFAAIVSFLMGILDATGTLSKVNNIENIEYIILGVLVFILMTVVLISLPTDDAKKTSTWSLVFLSAIPTFGVKYLTEYIVKSLFF